MAVTCRMSVGIGIIDLLREYGVYGREPVVCVKVVDILNADEPRFDSSF